MQYVTCVIKVICYDGKVQPLSRSTGIFHSSAKFAMVKLPMSYGNTWFTSPMNMIALFSYPDMHTLCMNVVGSVW